MTDEEIDQLSDLKKDRDQLAHVLSGINSIEDRYSEGCTKPGSRIAQFLKLARESGKRIVADGGSRSFALNISDFRNTIVAEKIRDIEEIHFKNLLKDLDELGCQIESALENYSGEKIKVYFKEKLKYLNSAKQKGEV
jgi:hypothetical protein